mgnify:CR=1 FL=1
MFSSCEKRCPGFLFGLTNIFFYKTIMSLTTPGCTMGDQISQDVRNKLEALNSVNQAFVEVTFDPPWNPEMITDEAKKKLGLGIVKPDNHEHIKIDEEWE